MIGFSGFLSGGFAVFFFFIVDRRKCPLILILAGVWVG